MVFPDQTVEDNLAAHIHRKDRARSARLMQSVFERFEVLAVWPKLLMLDEPCMGLDPAGIDAVFETIGELARRVSPC